ncbi:hypothetical protein L0Y40_00355 [Candidatus Wolfebacteria bacterium]|nr:hypothetical protein [Candidatus Wolfebacteria bacterium]
MKTLFTLLVFSLTTALFAAVPVGQSPQVALPDNEEFDLYPLMSGPLSADNQADMGLQVVRLPRSVRVLNWSAKVGPLYQTLLPGTLVLTDESGEVRYLVRCGNRVVVEGYARYRSRGNWEWEPPAPPEPEPKPTETVKVRRLRALPQFVANVFGGVFVKLPRWIFTREETMTVPAPAE